MRNAFLIFSFFIFFLITIFFKKDFLSRNPAALGTPDNLTLAEYKISNETSLYLIGIECSYKKYICENWEGLGFKTLKGDITHSSPRFLILKSDERIEKVYTFEFGASKRRNISASIEHGQKDSGHYFKLPEKIEAKLPPLLIDTLHARNHYRSGLRITLKILEFTPVSLPSKVIQDIMRFDGNKKFYQAAYLNRLLEMALVDESFPELIEAFGKEALKDLGGGLRIKFRGSSEDVITSTGIKDINRADFYEDFIRMRTEIQSINMSKLATRASEEGFILVPYSRDFAILFYDPEIQTDPERFNNLLLNTNIKKNEELYQRLTKSDQKLVPLGAFLLSDKVAPKKVIDFEVPQKVIRRERVEKIVDYAVEVGFLYTNTLGLSTALRTGYTGGKIFFKKKGKIYGSTMIESEAHLVALIESGLVKIEGDQVSKDVLLYYLDEMNVEESTYALYEEIFESKNKQRIDDAIKEILLLYETKQLNKRFSQGMNESYKISNRIISWLSFKKWLQTPDLENEIVDEISGKKIKSKRSPSSNLSDSKTETSAAFVFMVDGLRPDRFKEAYEKGLVPHLGDFFIKNGVRFNSYTNRSLTLPSWSSILTGLDQDEHGLKSNGPMSRELAKPTENFIDPRKDILNYAFNRENRAYRHLKESLHKWLPDYFEEGEVFTNYMPVNNESFLPVNKLLKGLIKDYQKVLFGNFSGSIALDRASALETIAHLKTNPGKTKLILNWFTCVDVFSHHNNKALEYCYRELDKSFKMIVDQLKKDPAFKDGHLFLISDHGHTGGDESAHSHYKLLDEGSYFNNTALNLTTLFAGSYRNYRQFDFTPYIFESPYPDNDLRFLKEFQIHPFRYKFKSKNKKERKAPDILIDYSGDSIAQIYFKHPVYGWDKRLKFNELQNFRGLDIINELQNVKVLNTVNYDPKVKNKLYSLHKGHPIKMIAHALNDCSVLKMSELLPLSTEQFEREPVLLMEKDKSTGLILTKMQNGEMLYQYFLLDDFMQNDNGECSAKLAQQPKDPLEQYDLIKGKWLSKNELLKIFQDHKYPTAITSLVSTLTLSKELAKNPKRKAEIPDLVLYSNIGFNFNSSSTTEGDHGGITAQESRNSFFYRKIDQSFSDKEKNEAFKNPVFNFYLTPFVLDVTERKKDETKFRRIPRFHEFFKVEED